MKRPIPTMFSALEQFSRSLEAKGLRPNTVKNHTQAVRRLTEVTSDISVSKLHPVHIEELFTHNNWSESTRNLYLNSLRNFIRWAHTMRYLERNYDPTEGWRNLTVPEEEQVRVPVEQFPGLLAAAPNPRDRAVVALGLYLFLRGSEVAHLRIQDVNFDDSTVNVYRLKTKQSDLMPMVTELREELLLWLNHWRATWGEPAPSDYLTPAMTKPALTWTQTGFPAPDIQGQQIKPQSPLSHSYEPVKRALAGIGYHQPGLGNHTLRRSGARALFDRLRGEGYDGALKRVSSMLGHADTRTTERYLGVGLERMQRNEMLAGKPMFTTDTASVTPIERAG